MRQIKMVRVERWWFDQGFIVNVEIKYVYDHEGD